jgi:excisionase family DNA binding protein
MVIPKNQAIEVGDLTPDPGPRPMFLTAAEVGQELGLKKSRVYELATAGLLPAVRLGRRMLFPRRGLDMLVESAIERTRARLDLNSS